MAALEVDDRTTWLADTFSGIPVSGSWDQPDLSVGLWPDRWVAGLDAVQAVFRRYGLLDENVRFLVGAFSETASQLPPTPLSILRLDADSYASTTDALEAFYPWLSVGGFVIVDDWHLPGARSAVLGYRRRHGIDDPLEPVYGPDGGSAYEMQWRRVTSARA